MSFRTWINEPGKRLRKQAVLCGLFLLVLAPWQLGLMRQRHRLKRPPLPSVSALAFPRDVFVYFFYHANLFPVTTSFAPLEDTAEGARRILSEHGDTLKMKPIAGFIWGDWAQVLLYFPSAWIRGSTENPDVRPLHGAVFVLALLFVFLAFWRAGRPGFGICLVLLAGSSQFQLYQVYAAKNVWGWPITANLTMLALFLPFFFPAWRVGRARVAIMAVLAGLYLGTLNHVRPETMSTAFAVVFAFLIFSRQNRRTALAGLAIFLVALLGVRQAWTSYFLGKIDQARAVVTAKGGVPYNGPMTRFHVVWHAVFCGLGDFDRTHGYAWDDRVAQAYAAPLLKKRYGIEGRQLKKEGWNPYVFEYREDGRVHHIALELAPGYTEIIRDKVLGDIRRDPLWFGGILARRLARVATQTTPLELRAMSWYASLLFPGGLLVLGAGALAWVTRARWFFSVLIFTAAPSLTAVLMYSGRGATSYSIYHFAAAAFLVSTTCRFLHVAASRFRARRRSAQSAAHP